MKNINSKEATRTPTFYGCRDYALSKTAPDSAFWMFDMKVSIIIPAHNAESTIVRCIDSLLAQTYSNMEIIIIDDGSQDKTTETIRKKYGKDVLLFTQNGNGVSSARNLGIEKSTGDYIMFLDADDTFSPNMIEKMMQCAKRFNAGIVKCGVKKIFADFEEVQELDELSNKVIETSHINSREKLVDLFLGNKSKISCLVMTLLIKKSIIIDHNIRFEKRLYFMEDVVFYVDLFLSGEKIFFLNEPLYNYYQNSDSVMHNKNNYAKNYLGIYETNAEIEKRIPGSSSINNAHFQFMFDVAAKQYMSGGGYPDIKKIKSVAEKANLKNCKRYWRIVKNAILNERKIILIILFCMLTIKNKKQQKKGLI